MTGGINSAGPKVSHTEQRNARRDRIHDGQVDTRIINRLPGEMRKLVCDELMANLVDTSTRGGPRDNRQAVLTRVQAILPKVEDAVKLALHTEAKDYNPNDRFSIFALEMSQPQTRGELSERLQNARVILQGILRTSHVNTDLIDLLCKPNAEGVSLFDQQAEQAVKMIVSKTMHEELRTDADRTTAHMADVDRQWRSIVGEAPAQGASRG